LAISFVIGAPFYLSLLARYGTLTAFNRAPEGSLSIDSKPPSFYTGLGSGMLFTGPLRPNFARQALPIFYSETWGDYNCYFAVAAVDQRKFGTQEVEYVSGQLLESPSTRDPQPRWLTSNYNGMRLYLGRVNLVSLLPTALLFAGFLAGLGDFFLVLFRRRAGPGRLAGAFFFLIVAASLAGYAWFLIRYPVEGRGDTVKATYLLHIFPFLALLTGGVLDRLSGMHPKAWAALLAGLGLVALHNLPAMVTHYVPWLRYIHYFRLLMEDGLGRFL
jgi:hypothetical protein